MQRLLFAAAMLAVAVYTLRRVGSPLGQRAMRECETRFANMPEEFPPKRMMRDLDVIREQNARILRYLEARQPVVT